MFECLAESWAFFCLLNGVGDLYLRQDGDSDLNFAHDASASGQCVQQWMRRIAAKESASREIADGKLRLLLARKKSFDFADVKVGDFVLFHKIVSRGSAPRWRGPDGILDIDETGGTATFQGRAFKVARCCVRERVGPLDAGDGSESGSC